MYMFLNFFHEKPACITIVVSVEIYLDLYSLVQLPLRTQATSELVHELVLKIL